MVEYELVKKIVELEQRVVTIENILGQILQPKQPEAKEKK